MQRILNKTAVFVYCEFHQLIAQFDSLLMADLFVAQQHSWAVMIVPNSSFLVHFQLIGELMHLQRVKILVFQV